MNRRDFLKTAGLVSATAAALPTGFVAQAETVASWRTFEVTTHVEILKPSGATRIWLPTPLTGTTYQKTSANSVKSDGGIVRTFESGPEALGIVTAEFSAHANPIIAVTSRVATRNRHVNFSGSRATPKTNSAELKYWLRPTKALPTDGIVKETALKITGSAQTDAEKARAIYEWIVENTYRNPKTRGCGVGNIRFMLESGDLGGKCADLNALYVGLARAAGLPARDVYGIRVAKSNVGFKSLGVSSNIITKAQHCRAEVYLSDYGWVAVDPADVRKVMLEEPPGNRSLDDEMVKKSRTRLFGSWEMNWIAYNFAGDVALPGSTGASLNFLMYPQAETAEGRLDCLDPDNFKYEITSKEITAAGA